MRRHLVMDLYHSQETEEIGEWKNVDKLPDVQSCKVKVKLDNGSETFAYFYNNACSWGHKYGIKVCYFWHSNTHEAITNVKEWKMVK